MANLSVENLSRIVQSGDTERLFTGTMQEAAQSPGNHIQNQATDSPRNFAEILQDSVEKTNLYQNQADTAMKELVAGRNKNIHETMLTIERADTSLKLMMQVRNKILDAYREVMRMQV